MHCLLSPLPIGTLLVLLWGGAGTGVSTRVVCGFRTVSIMVQGSVRIGNGEVCCLAKPRHLDVCQLSDLALRGSIPILISRHQSTLLHRQLPPKLRECCTGKANCLAVKSRLPRFQPSCVGTKTRLVTAARVQGPLMGRVRRHEAANGRG